MQRLVNGVYREAIAEAMATIPDPIIERLQFVHFLTGTDPIYAGLHAFTETEDGRSYFDTAHCAYPFHTSDRSTTIVLPIEADLDDLSVVVHELGHALDFALGFKHEALPITEYAATDRYEAFAESFRGWLYWYGDQDVFHSDKATLALFDGLAQE